MQAQCTTASQISALFAACCALRFQIRNRDIKELAKMAASSTDDAAKKTFQE
jgi:hypothetical protein